MGITESYCKIHNLNLYHILQEGYFEKLPQLNFLDFKYMLECYEEDIAEADKRGDNTYSQEELDDTGTEENIKLEERVELLEKLLKENGIEY